ncbi:hypothetical protein CFP56_020463 [Quercus suber]|uniref:S-protein homolog n=1 Tax=Quercus suber TaxID=58331 RepID=A0AAW0LZF4_QUESU
MVTPLSLCFLSFPQCDDDGDIHLHDLYCFSVLKRNGFTFKGKYETRFCTMDYGIHNHYYLHQQFKMRYPLANNILILVS